MTTISQLPVATTPSSTDVLPLSQSGVTCQVQVGSLLAGTQPALTLAPGAILGRVSSGAGAPEPINLGSGLSITNGSLIASGVMGPAGPTGAQGAQGASLRSGTTAPTAAIGNDGDTYLNTVTGDVYARANATWSKTGNVAGPAGSTGATGSAGATGSSLLSGTGAPSSSSGNNGDSFINTATGDIYLKSAGTWTKTGNVMGPSGPQGPVGPQGPAGTVSGVPSAPLLGGTGSSLQAVSLGSGLAMASNALGVALGGLDGSTSVATATGGSASRKLADHLCDVASVKQLGAKGDGSTDDTAAIQAAQQAGHPWTLPSGTYKTSIAATALTGPFRGPGQVQTSDSNRHGTYFCNVSSSPASVGNWNTVAGAFSGDVSRLQFPIEHRITGATTLGQPSTGYNVVQETSAVALYLHNESGHNASTSAPSGRTAAIGISLTGEQSGQGDLMLMYAQAHTASTLPGATHFLANPAISILAGELDAQAAGVYLNPVEIDLNDNGYDVAAIGPVINLNRTNATGALGTMWIGSRIQSIGTAAVDAAYSAIGFYNIGLDLSSCLNSGSVAAVSVRGGDRIYLDATNTDTHLNPAKTVLGGSWLTHSVTDNAVEIGHNGALALQVVNPASAVNWLRANGSATGGATSIQAVGSDASIIAAIFGKGAGSGVALGSDGAVGFSVSTVATTDKNFLQARSAPSGAAPALFALSASGDTNVTTGMFGHGNGGVALGNDGTVGFKATSASGDACYLQAQSAASGSAPGLYAIGSNAGIKLVPSGTGVVTAPTAAATDSSTTVATTAFVKNQAYITASSAAVAFTGGTIDGAVIGGNNPAAITGTSVTAKGAANAAGLAGAATGAPVSLVATGSDANIGIAVITKGTGALTAQVPDSTSNGGNARGADAVDWQSVRSAATQVASGANAALVGGSGNTASASYAIAGGINNAASGTAAVAFGQGNAISGSFSVAPGGIQGNDRGTYGKLVFASGLFSVQGDAQVGVHTLRAVSTSATAVRATADGNAAGSVNSIPLPNNGAFACRGFAVARNTSTGDTAMWTIDALCAKRGASASATSLVGTPTVTKAQADTNASSWALSVAADTTNGAIAFSVTGAASTTIHLVLRLDTVEVQ